MTSKAGTSMDHIARNFVIRWQKEHSIIGNKISQHYPRSKVTTEDLLVEMLVAFVNHLERNKY